MRTFMNLVLFIGLVLYVAFLMVSNAFAAPVSKPVYIPPLALQYMPILKDEITTHWPALPTPSMLAAQVEQDSYNMYYIYNECYYDCYCLFGKEPIHGSRVYRLYRNDPI